MAQERRFRLTSCSKMVHIMKFYFFFNLKCVYAHVSECMFVPEMSMLARAKVSDPLDVESGDCEPPDTGTGECGVRFQDFSTPPY